MLASRYVRGELVSVVAPVPADVALEGVAEAVAAHVDGEHHVIQKEDAAVVAAVDPDGLPFLAGHPAGVARAGGGRLGDVQRPREILQGLEAVARRSGGELAGMEGGIRPLLVVAVRVRGVLAAVVGGKTPVGGQAFVPEVAVALVHLRRGAVGHVGAGQGDGVQAADDGDHFGGGGRRRLHERAQGFGAQVGDGVVYSLVHHASLHYVAFLLVQEARAVSDIKTVPFLTCKRGEVWGETLLYPPESRP